MVVATGPRQPATASGRLATGRSAGLCRGVVCGLRELGLGVFKMYPEWAHQWRGERDPAPRGVPARSSSSTSSFPS